MASLKKLLTVLCAFACYFDSGIAVDTSHPQYHRLPPLREQASIINAWRDERTDAIPALLRKYKVDAWLMSQKEYAEDTAFWSLKSATQFSARRRTTSLFFANATGDVKPAYNWIDNTPSVWSELRDVLEVADPQSIAVNVDADIAFSSGLHAGELVTITTQLGSPWKERLVSVPMIAVEYIGTMPTGRLEWYQKLMETAWAMISDGFSEKVISPGITTTEDVEWWLREKIQEMNYTTWFHPDVTIVEPGMKLLDFGRDKSRQAPAPATIHCGELLHVDFGVTALGMNTDTQHLAFVLPPGDSGEHLPESLLKGLRTVNRLQDIVRKHMIPGTSGNDILSAALAEMEDAGIQGKIYSHPIGDWGHSAGTLIGMTNLQEGVPVLGDLPLLKDTWYSVELYAESAVPEMNGAMLPFFLEEDVYWDEQTRGFEWVYGRQENYHLIKTAADENFLHVQS